MSKSSKRTAFYAFPPALAPDERVVPGVLRLSPLFDRIPENRLAVVVFSARGDFPTTCTRWTRALHGVTAHVAIRQSDGGPRHLYPGYSAPCALFGAAVAATLFHRQHLAVM